VRRHVAAFESGVMTPHSKLEVGHIPLSELQNRLLKKAFHGKVSLLLNNNHHKQTIIGTDPA
jgi:hypothetical protein